MIANSLDIYPSIMSKRCLQSTIWLRFFMILPYTTLRIVIHNRFNWRDLCCHATQWFPQEIIREMTKYSANSVHPYGAFSKIVYCMSAEYIQPWSSPLITWRNLPMIIVVFSVNTQIKLSKWGLLSPSLFTEHMNFNISLIHHFRYFESFPLNNASPFLENASQWRGFFNIYEARFLRVQGGRDSLSFPLGISQCRRIIFRFGRPLAPSFLIYWHFFNSSGSGDIRRIIARAFVL